MLKRTGFTPLVKLKEDWGTFLVTLKEDWGTFLSFKEGSGIYFINVHDVLCRGTCPQLILLLRGNAHGEIFYIIYKRERALKFWRAHKTKL
jgi:hypothetical protein